MPVRIIKEISVVAALLIYSGIYFWWLSRAWDSTTPLWEGSALLVVSLLWVALLSASLALLTDTAAAGILIVGVPLLLVLVHTELASAAGAATMLAAGLLHARWHIRLALTERLRYRTVPTFFTAARWQLVSLAAAAAGLAAPTVIDRLRTDVIAIPERIVEQALRPALTFIGGTAPGQGTAMVTMTADLLNRYLTSALQANPELAATVVLSVAFLVAHLVIPLLVWPTLAVISLVMLTARRAELVYLVSYPTVAQRLSLEREIEDHV